MNRLSRIEIGFAISVIALGLYLFIGSSDISLGSGYDRIGPRFFPYIIAAGLLMTSIVMLITSWRNRQDNIVLPIEMMPLAFITLGLVLCVMTLERLGFILAVTLLFICIARAFNSKNSIRDGSVGLVLSISVYFIFTSGLGLVLPKGIFSGIL